MIRGTPQLAKSPSRVAMAAPCTCAMALSKDAEALKISLIDRYPHLFAVNSPRPLASGIHRVLAEQTGAPMPVLKLALTKLTRRNAYLAALGAGQGLRMKPRMFSSHVECDLTKRNEPRSLLL